MTAVMITMLTGVYNAELVLTGILRQQLDYALYPFIIQCVIDYE